MADESAKEPTPTERLEHAEGLFSHEFGECMRAHKGNVVAASEQLLQKALTDAPLGNAIIYMHICFFLEGAGRAIAAEQQSATAPATRLN